MRKRTKVAYDRLFDDPSSMFGSCRVILFPNGEPEIWIQSPDGRRSFAIRASDGPAGLGLTIARHGGPEIVVHGNRADDEWTPFPEKGSADVALREVSLTQYKDDLRSQRFREWYGGRGSHPDHLQAVDGIQAESS